MANTVPALVLGFLMTLAGMGRFIYATAIIWILGGLGTWLIGNLGACGGLATNHIGASGLIFGWLAFLMIFGWFTRNAWEIVVGVVVLIFYGGILWGAIPELDRCNGVSWQGTSAVRSRESSRRISCQVRNVAPVSNAGCSDLNRRT